MHQQERACQGSPAAMVPPMVFAINPHQQPIVWCIQQGYNQCVAPCQYWQGHQGYNQCVAPCQYWQGQPVPVVGCQPGLNGAATDLACGTTNHGAGGSIGSYSTWRATTNLPGTHQMERTWVDHGKRAVMRTPIRSTSARAVHRRAPPNPRLGPSLMKILLSEMNQEGRHECSPHGRRSSRLRGGSSPGRSWRARSTPAEHRHRNIENRDIDHSDNRDGRKVETVNRSYPCGNLDYGSSRWSDAAFE